MPKRRSGRTRPDPPTPVARGPRSRRGWTRRFEQRRWQMAAVALVIFLTLVVRVNYLGADPPADASWSHDLLTDPPQYTAYARTAVAIGEWNSLDEERLVFYRNNITGAFAYFVFLLFGPGVFAANLTAVLLNLVAVGFLAWGVGRAFGFTAGFGAAWFLAVNYLFVVYSRQPFLEVAANACLAVAFWGIVASLRRWWWVLVAGLMAGVATFFGKVTAMHAVPVFLIGAALVGWQARTEPVWRRWGRPAGYALGFGFVGIVWYLAIYRHVSGEVLAYLKEQTLLLYGMPIGLTSVSGFLQQWYTFGLNNEILGRVPILALVGFLGMCLMVVGAARGIPWRQILTRVSPVVFLLLGWFWSAWAAFSPFNYRPVRYQVVLLLPLAAAAGWMLQQWVKRDRQPPPDPSGKVPWWPLPILAVVISSGFVHLLVGLFPDALRGRFSGTGLAPMAMIVGVLLSVGWIILMRARRTQSASAGWRRSAIEFVVALVLLIPLANQGRQFLSWWSRAAYTFEAANRDLATVVGPDAVLTGGWAGPLLQTADSSRALLHFFHLTEPEDFFSRNPITHVVIEDIPDALFFKEFPELGRGCEKVTAYTVRNMRVAVFRISHLVENLEARGYQLSTFERLQQDTRLLPPDSGLAIAAVRVADSVDSFTGWRFLGELYQKADSLNGAVAAYRRALLHYPDDLVLLVHTGDLTWQKYLIPGRGRGARQDREDAIALWRRALRMSPGSVQLMERIRTAERS